MTMTLQQRTAHDIARLRAQHDIYEREMSLTQFGSPFWLALNELRHQASFQLAVALGANPRSQAQHPTNLVPIFEAAPIRFEDDTLAD